MSGNPVPDRPKSLGFDGRDQVISPQNFRSGSDSNLSFDSLSPIELPDSSTDFGMNSTKGDSTESHTQMVPEVESNAKGEPDSGIRIRRKGQATLVSSGNISLQTKDCTIYEAKEAGDHVDNGVRGQQEITDERLMSEKTDNKYVDDMVATDKGLDNQEVIALHEDSVRGEISHELASRNSSRQEDTGSRRSCLQGSDEESCEKSTAEECNLSDGSTYNVVLSALRCEEIVEQNYEKDMDRPEISSENAVDRQGALIPRKQIAIGPLSIKVSSSSRIHSEAPGVKKDSSLKRPPKVAPKPTSPPHTSDSSTDVGDELTDQTKELNISGNTRKLRDRFTAESGIIDSDMKHRDRQHGQAKDSPVNQSPGKTREKVQLVRSVSSTAKLVEKFTKEAEKKIDGREESPVTRSGMSVREILKQFESGDEMDDAEVQTPGKKSSYSRERVSQTSVAVGEDGPENLPREQKQLNLGNRNDEKMRNASDFAGRREPKFV